MFSCFWYFCASCHISPPSRTFLLRTGAGFPRSTFDGHSLTHRGNCVAPKLPLELGLGLSANGGRGIGQRWVAWYEGATMNQHCEAMLPFPATFCDVLASLQWNSFHWQTLFTHILENKSVFLGSLLPELKLNSVLNDREWLTRTLLLRTIRTAAGFPRSIFNGAFSDSCGELRCTEASPWTWAGPIGRGIGHHWVMWGGRATMNQHCEIMLPFTHTFWDVSASLQWNNIIDKCCLDPL